MEINLPTSLTVALYAGSIALVVLAVIVTAVLVRLHRQMERIVAMVERVESEIGPVVREARVAVHRARDVSERVHRQWLALERFLGTVRRFTGAAGGLVMAPMLATNRAGNTLRVGTAAFLRALWTGRRPSARGARREDMTELQ